MNPILIALVFLLLTIGIYPAVGTAAAVAGDCPAWIAWNRHGDPRHPLAVLALAASWIAFVWVAWPLVLLHHLYEWAKNP